MEDKRGIGGRIAIPVQYENVRYNDQEYTVGLITKLDGNLVHFLIDEEDKVKTSSRSWHHVTVGYIGSGYKIEGQHKMLYLHNLIMNRLDFDGKGTPVTVDHISGNGLDNRKKNLRLCSQSEQNRNTGKRPRKTDKLPNEIREEMPTNVWYAPANGHHGDRFVVEIKGIPGIEDIIWKTTSSKSVTTREKLTSAITKRQELIDSMPALYNFIRDAELSQTLRDEYDEIIELVSISRIEHVD